MHPSVCVHTQPKAKTWARGFRKRRPSWTPSFGAGKTLWRGELQFLTTRKLASSLLDSKWLPSIGAVSPSKLSLRTFSSVACFVDRPLGPLVRSCSCRACAGTAAIWAGLGNKTHCPPHTSKHPAPRFYLGETDAQQRGLAQPNQRHARNQLQSQGCKGGTLMTNLMSLCTASISTARIV